MNYNIFTTIMCHYCFNVIVLPLTTVFSKEKASTIIFVANIDLFFDPDYMRITQFRLPEILSDDPSRSASVFTKKHSVSSWSYVQYSQSVVA